MPTLGSRPLRLALAVFTLLSATSGASALTVQVLDLDGGLLERSTSAVQNETGSDVGVSAFIHSAGTYTSSAAFGDLSASTEASVFTDGHSATYMSLADFSFSETTATGLRSVVNRTNFHFGIDSDASYDLFVDYLIEDLMGTPALNGWSVTLAALELASGTNDILSATTVASTSYSAGVFTTSGSSTGVIGAGAYQINVTESLRPSMAELSGSTTLDVALDLAAAPVPAPAALPLVAFGLALLGLSRSRRRRTA